MKRRAVLDRLHRAAASRNLQFDIIELTRHSAVQVGRTVRTLGRHAEINDIAAKKFWEQFSDELGKGWWR